MKGLYKHITFLTTVVLMAAGSVSFSQQSGNAKAPIQFDSPSKIINHTEHSGYGHNISFDRTPLHKIGMMAEVPTGSAVESLQSPESAFDSDDETKVRHRKSLTDTLKCDLRSGAHGQPSVFFTKNIALLPMAGGSAIGAP